MYRRYPLGMLVAVVLFLATFVAEPGATMRFTAEAFSAVGEFGGALVSEIVSGDDTGRGV